MLSENVKNNPTNFTAGEISPGEIDQAYNEFNKRNKKNERRGKNLVDILRTIANGINEISDQNVNLNFQS